MANENIYDKTFKKIISETTEAIALIKACFPKKIAENLDYETLTLMPDSFIDDQINEHASDVIYACQLKSGKEIWLNFIFEHKSYLPNKPEIQLLKYIADGYSYQRQEKLPITQIIPVVLYHGKEKWKIRQITDYMQHEEAYLNEYSPSFKYILIDLADYSDDELFAIEMGFALRHILLLFKHKGDAKFVLQETKKIFIFENQNLTQEEVNERNRIIFIYISRAFTLAKAEVKEMLMEMPETIKTIGMTTYDMFVLEGEKKGLQKGLQKGLEKGLQKVLIEKINFSLNLILMPTIFSIAKVAEMVDVPIDFIRKMEKGFKEGNEKKARKILYSFFDKYERIEDTEIKEIEAILKKYLPKFKALGN